MAISIKEAPWYIQAFVFVALAVLLIAVGEYVPGLPVASAREDVQNLTAQDTKINQEVSALQVYERRYSEFQQEVTALNNQLETLKAIVPEEKATDEFMRLTQGAASAAGVQIRSMKAQAVVSKEYHFEMPFEIQVDGPYFQIVDFFSRLSRLSRIINVGNLKFSGLGDGVGRSAYPVRPSTTVTGTCIVTTFFTMPASQPVPAATQTAAAQPASQTAAPGTATH
jgi:type IV pilus assembly protein PilO